MDNTLFFYSHHKKQNDPYDRHVFSQWYPCVFHDDAGQIYTCAEQYMMAEKAKLFIKNKKNIETYELILASSDPKTIKELGRKIKDFDEKKWNEHKLEIVKKGNFFKFGQNLELKKILLATGTKELVEASPYDAIWGIGLSEKNAITTPRSEWGTNLLGIALVATREKLRQ